MAKKIEIRDDGELIGWVADGGYWQDAPGRRSTDVLLVGKSFEQMERLFCMRSQHRPPSESQGRMFQDGYSFHFSG